MTKLKVKRLTPNAILPTRGSEFSCGLDIYSIQELIIDVGDRKAIQTGISIEIPPNHYGRIAPRSGFAIKYGIDVLAGVIDSDYRGEIICLLINLGQEKFKINKGDRVAQIIFEKVSIMTPEWSLDIDETTRGLNGFGSTGF